MTEPVAGKSILDLLWEEMDDVVDLLQEEGQPASWADEHVRGRTPRDEIGVASEWQSWGERRGRAQGLAYALAVILNPYEPDVPAVKREAMARWDARQDE